MVKKAKQKTEDEDEAPEVETKKYGISDLCEILESEPHLVRARLRAEGIEKAGKRYGWDTKAELQEVVDTLEERSKRKPAMTKKAKANDDDEGEEDEAPKKTAKKGAKKKAA